MERQERGCYRDSIVTNRRMQGTSAHLQMDGDIVWLVVETAHVQNLD